MVVSGRRLLDGGVRGRLFGHRLQAETASAQAGKAATAATSSRAPRLSESGTGTASSSTRAMSRPATCAMARAAASLTANASSRAAAWRSTGSAEVTRLLRSNVAAGHTDTDGHEAERATTPTARNGRCTLTLATGPAAGGWLCTASPAEDMVTGDGVGVGVAGVGDW